MKIAVLSGKGGTGKTFVSVNLAAASNGATYVDCDVEEPNGHLFLKPENIKRQDVSVKIPVVNQEKCNGCRKCVEFCKFNAMAYINQKVVVFKDICHSCGGCALLCPQNAIQEEDKIIGSIESGISDNVDVKTGILNTGEISGVPIINKMYEDLSINDDLVIIDCPPGSACVVMESIKDADYCVLVAEPTLFGAHNMAMVYELVTLFKKPFGVVLNKCVDNNNPSEEFCIQNNIPILEKIPFSSKIGRINSDGLIAVKEDEEYKNKFADLLERIVKEVQK